LRKDGVFLDVYGPTLGELSNPLGERHNIEICLISEENNENAFEHRFA
jgi:hypothetical protein